MLPFLVAVFATLCGSGFGSVSCCAEENPLHYLPPDQFKEISVRVRSRERWLDFPTILPGERLCREEESLCIYLNTFEDGRLSVMNSGAQRLPIEGVLVSAQVDLPISTLLSNGYQSWSISPLVGAPPSMIFAEGDVLSPRSHNTDVVSLEANASWWFLLAAGPSSEKSSSILFAAPESRDKLKTRYAVYREGEKTRLVIAKGFGGERLTLNGFREPDLGYMYEFAVTPRDVRGKLSAAQGLGFSSVLGSHPPFVPIGWNSWNTLFDKVGEADILANAKFIKESLPELGINNIQVDDGWEKNWGDWEANEKFPDGMDGTARKIREMGFTPGIWFAPFLLDETSSVAKEHPDWLQQGFDGELIKYAVANFGGGATKLILDTTHPEANAWMLGQIRKIVGWGYRYLKLDFLFGGAIEGNRFDPAKTSIEAYRDAMMKIAEAAGPDAYILACGAPIMPSIGIAHGIRIGPDVAFFNLPLEWRYVKAEVLNLASRHFLWPAIAPDPDTALVRDLPENEVRFFLAATLMAPGIFAIGDHLPALPQDRLNLYRRIAPLIPKLYGTPEIGTQQFSVPYLFDFPSSIVPKTNLEPYIVPGSFPIPTTWIRRMEESALIALLNGEDFPQQVSLDLASHGLKGRFSAEEVFSGEKADVPGNLTADLSPREGRLYLLSSP